MIIRLIKEHFFNCTNERKRCTFHFLITASLALKPSSQQHHLHYHQTITQLFIIIFNCRFHHPIDDCNANNLHQSSSFNCLLIGTFRAITQGTNTQCSHGYLKHTQLCRSSSLFAIKLFTIFYSIKSLFVVVFSIRNISNSITWSQTHNFQLFVAVQ